MKVEILEAVFAALSRRAHERPALLCGDFNTPQCELSSGEIVTWAQRIDPSGRICLKARIRRGPGDRWDAAERNILSGLRQFGFRDVYRSLHGYAINSPSWVLKRKGVSIGRRFDHLFASDHLKVARCAYLDEWRLTGLSDHSALETEVDLLGSDSWQTSTIPSSLASPTDAV